jgi:S1-C subfamily serine protease
MYLETEGSAFPNAFNQPITASRVSLSQSKSETLSVEKTCIHSGYWRCSSRHALIPRPAAGGRSVRWASAGQWNPDVLMEFASMRADVGSRCETNMHLSHQISGLAKYPVALGVRAATLGALLISTYLAQCHGVIGAEINASAASRPVGFAEIVARVKPAVIAVTVRLENDVAVEDKDEPGAPSQSQPFSQNSPLHRYFFGSPNQQPRSTPHTVRMALGSGFFISPDGFAVTNDHVVQHGVSFMIATEDGTTYKARVVGADLRTDLALLKVDGRNDFPYVKLADHEPRIGDWVIAVGNPYGLGGTVTAGIVSALGRRLDTDSYDDFIQLDAPINKGNSGGPSFDADGEVVGVNTAIFSPSGGSVGIGFAIPATAVKPVIQQLR